MFANGRIRRGGSLVTRHCLLASAARYSVTVDADMEHVYHEGFCRSNCYVRIHADTRKRAYQGRGAGVQPSSGGFRYIDLSSQNVCLTSRVKSSTNTSSSPASMPLRPASATARGSTFFM